jgi:DNA-directed RNA polymerase specialized sigma24 family protein
MEKRRRDEESDRRDADSLRDGQAFLDWAIPQLSPRRRGVIELDRDGVPVKDIQKRLGVSRDVVYQARHLGLDDLAKLRDSYQP